MRGIESGTGAQIYSRWPAKRNPKLACNIRDSGEGKGTEMFQFTVQTRLLTHGR